MPIERSDTVRAVSNAEILTQKHYLLRLRSHTKTGQEKILQILKKFDIVPATTKWWILKQMKKFS